MKFRRFAVHTVAGMLLAVEAQAAVSAVDLADLSIEQLMNESVTSVSKREQSLLDAAAAISVLTNDDIRRSGATSVAETLRLVPGMDVGQINSSQWSISSRGFSGQYSNKLLVMVDGRAVYTPTLAGVYWDLQQTMLEDVDRIEVIRGPGGTLWGANAVNGVINIESKSARDTQGGLLYAGGGDVHLTTEGARYGGRIGENTYYRVFGSYQLSDAYEQPSGGSAMDGWQSESGGFRIDHYQGEDTHFTWQGDATVVDFNENASDGYNVNTLGRWTHELAERSSVEVQAYYDRTYRNEITRARPTVDTFDLIAQHTFGVGDRNDVIWGLGYRFIGNDAEQTTPTILVHEGDLNLQLFSGFIQDEFKLIPDKLILTAGTKIEHNDFTGIEIQPSVRAVFKPAANQTLWAAVSRAVRTPDVLEDSDVFAVQIGEPIAAPGGPYVPRIVGTANPDSEVLWAYELGYRIQPEKRVNVDVALFYNDYNQLIDFGTTPDRFVPGDPEGTAEFPLMNIQSGHTYGGEASVTVEPIDHWRLSASYSLLLADIGGPVPVGSPEMAETQQQAILRSSLDFGRASIDAQFRAVDQETGVEGYVTADVRLSYRPTDALDLSLVGQNLLDAGHQEATQFFGTTNGIVPRGFFARVTWKF
ncbi:MAG: TonB-dependent receptor [Luteolibacter sp.]|uniref:TonB-dependent receptor plug domain-containing protein n=1 Tax=Luteolibacter sp. TaxID=1962973 RepID=UPI00326506DE